MKIKKPKNLIKIDKHLEGFLFNLQVLSGDKNWNEVIINALNTYDFLLRYKRAGFQYKMFQLIPEKQETIFEIPIRYSTKKA